MIVGKPTDIFYAIDPDLEIHSDDIVIKRITPMYVNYIEKIDNGLFAGNNLILITASKDFYAKYIAAILNEKILTLSEETSVGAVMKSVGRQALEEIKIAWIAYERQVAIGNLWFHNIERKKMMNRLVELEYNRTNYYISHLAENGGKEHG